MAERVPRDSLLANRERNSLPLWLRNQSSEIAFLRAEMPRYFFDGTDGRELVDQLGAEYPDEPSARQEAVLRAMNGTAHQLEHYRGCKSILLRNENGDRICKVTIRRGWAE